MNVLDLFSGIGGFSLGLERAGMQTVAFCECDPYARAVLAKHWPGVPCYPAVCELSAPRLAADGIAVDVICGGFPCQDISFAGNCAGLAGERSGLWREYARLVSEIRPRYVIVENVAALLNRGLAEVLGDLAAIGYDAEWHCIQAADVGAPHRRDRIWIIAHTRSEQHESSRIEISRQIAAELLASNADSDGEHDGAVHAEVGNTSEPMADANCERCREARRCSCGRWIGGSGRPVGEQWATEPDVGRVAHGVPARVDRLRCLGNAVVPQIPEIIGRAIMKAASSA